MTGSLPRSFLDAGRPVTLSGAVPAAGAEVQYVHTGPTAILISSIAFDATPATVGRIIGLLMVRNFTTIVATRNAGTLPAATCPCAALAGGSSPLASSIAAVVFSWPVNSIMIEGDILITNTTAIQPTDQYSAMTICGVQLHRTNI